MPWHVPERLGQFVIFDWSELHEAKLELQSRNLLGNPTERACQLRQDHQMVGKC